jgi:Arc/MetJ-type ribon-helix-helix transcriptional regulator
MTIHVSEDLERVIRDAMRAGSYTREDDVIRDALIRLRQDMPQSAATSQQDGELGEKGKQLTKQEFQRHLVEIGLLDQAPDASATAASPDEQMLDSEGEIVSELVIRERLIEWLTGFITT